VLALAKRFHAAGHHIYLDYHFSDDWADPQHNNAPTAWPTALGPLSHTLRTYVTSTLGAFAAADVPLALVSLGNEIRHGMLWPTGRADVDVTPSAARVANFTGLATLVGAARAGVADAVAAHALFRRARPQVMLHIDNGWNHTLQQTWFETLLATGRVTEADWDVFGFSFYPFYGTAATFANLRETLGWVARRFGKPVQVVETDYPAICNGTALSEPSVPVSVEGQIEWVQEVIDIVQDLPNGLGRGVHYWEPAWLNLTSLGSSCADAILFDVDWSQYPTAIGYSRKSVDMFKGA
jgi:arabinogalactan endo-1,4-beta-galactosidase